MVKISKTKARQYYRNDKVFGFPNNGIQWSFLSDYRRHIYRNLVIWIMNDERFKA